MSSPSWLEVGSEQSSTVWGVVRQMKVVAVVTALLSLAIAVVESLATAGLVTMLASGTSTLDMGQEFAKSIANGPAVLALAAASLLLNGAQTWLRERVTGDWELARRLDLIAAFRQADYSVQSNYSSGRLSVDGEYIAAGANTIGGVVGLIGFAARALVYGITSLVASWQVAAVAVACGSVLVFILRIVSRRTRSLNDAVAGAYREVSEDIADLAPSSRELHSLNRWSETDQRLSGRLEHIRATRFTARVLAGMVGPVYAMGTLMVGVGVAVWAARSGQGTGRLAISGLLLVRSLGSAQSTQVGYQTVNDTQPFMDSGLIAIEELRAAARISDSAPGTLVGSSMPAIEVDRACISYGNDTVVDDLSLTLEGRGGVALIGPSGAGKSTTLLALSGLLTPDSGTVRCDGVDLSTVDLAGVTEVIGYLPQDPRLIRASLRDNLVRWPRGLDDAELTGVLADANLLKTVDGFDGGIDAEMGRAAEGLSGGELQRLGLVRLLLAGPPIMLLDEPTSALDRANADRVAELIEARMRDHLVILVTHRPDLLLHCSEMIYMEDGRAIDRGTLSELSERHPFVAAMAQGLEQEGPLMGAADPDPVPIEGRDHQAGRS